MYNRLTREKGISIYMNDGFDRTVIEIGEDPYADVDMVKGWSIIRTPGMRMRKINPVDDPCCCESSNIVIKPSVDFHGAYSETCRVCGRSLGTENGQTFVITSQEEKE